MNYKPSYITQPSLPAAINSKYPLSQHLPIISLSQRYCTLFKTLAFTSMCLVAALHGNGATEELRSVEVRNSTGTPTLYINGQRHNPLIYFAGPHRITSLEDGGAAVALSADRWASKHPRTLHTFELAAKNGIHLHSFDLQMPWSKPNESVDYRDNERAIEAVLSRDPKGLFLLRFTMDPPEWWRDSHPHELMQWQGPDGVTTALNERDYSRVKSAVSVASSVWRKDAGEQLSAFIKHMEGKYGNHIIGYHFCGQHSHEWFYLASRADALNCCEPVFTESWRRWLREKYRTDDALRTAWRDPAVTFLTAKAPSYQQRINATSEFFRDPASESNIIDFHEYQNVAVAEALGYFAHIVKRDSRKLAVCFYGYLFEHGTIPHGVQQSGHLALGYLLKCPDIDAICSPISYTGALRGYESRMPGGIAAFMTTVDSVALHGKLWFNEDDTRTYLSKDSRHESLSTLDETRNVHQRNFAHLVVRGMSCWWMDLGGRGWLDSEDIWSNLGALSRYYDKSVMLGAQFNPEIAVIADERSCYALTQGRQPIARNLLFGIRDPLYRIGAPVGYYLLEDFIAGLVPAKKLYVFVNCWMMTETTRIAIAKQCASRTAVFLYGNGLIDKTISTDNMEKILGVPLVMSDPKISGRCNPITHNLTRGVTEFGVNEQMKVISLDQSSSKSKVDILAKYINGLPAAWMHSGDYKAIYLGALAVPPELLRNIAIAAGVHIYTGSNDVAEANGQFFAIHSGASGDKVISLPGSARVSEALTGVTVGDAITTWTVPMQKGETRLYALDYGKDHAPTPTATNSGGTTP